MHFHLYINVQPPKTVQIINLPIGGSIDMQWSMHLHLFIPICLYTASNIHVNNQVSMANIYKYIYIYLYIGYIYIFSRLYMCIYALHICIYGDIYPCIQTELHIYIQLKTLNHCAQDTTLPKHIALAFCQFLLILKVFTLF